MPIHPPACAGVACLPAAKSVINLSKGDLLLALNEGKRATWAKLSAIQVLPLGRTPPPTPPHPPTHTHTENAHHHQNMHDGGCGASSPPVQLPRRVVRNEYMPEGLRAQPL